MTDTLVLCYHAVSESWRAALSVTPERLESQLGSLLRRGYRGATFADAVADRTAGKTLVVTFDDAYRSVVKFGLPILRDLGVPATVFVPTAFAGSEQPMSWPGISGWLGGPHAEDLIPASWSELQGLAGEGWEIGSHTRSHPRLPELDDAALREELELSRIDCEDRLGIPCRTIAYPYADCNARVADAARSAGYLAACAMSWRVERRNRYLWPRVGMYEFDQGWRFNLKVSPIMRRARVGVLSGMRQWLRQPAD